MTINSKFLAISNQSYVLTSPIAHHKSDAFYFKTPIAVHAIHDIQGDNRLHKEKIDQLIQDFSSFRLPTQEKKDSIRNRSKNIRKEKNRKIKIRSVRIPKNFNYYDLEELEDQFLQAPLPSLNVYLSLLPRSFEQKSSSAYYPHIISCHPQKTPSIK